MAALAALLAWAPLGCTGPTAHSGASAPSHPDEALKPGLSLLTPYDFQGGSLQGLRWLDNFALNQPRSAAGRRARYWLLRARIDWLTRAYLEPDTSARLAALQGLMDHLGVAHGASLNNAELFAVVEALEGHARGLQRIPEYEEVGDGALALLQVFRNLDLSPGYFEGIARLRAALPDDGLPSEASAAVFAPNALLIASTDLLAQLPELDRLSPERQPHLLARLMAYTCPRGLVAFASAPLEEREEALRELCGWPCPEAGELTPPDRPSVLQACGHAVFSGPSLFSVGNEAVVRLLGDLSLMGRQGRQLLDERAAATKRFPVLAARWGELERLVDEIDGRAFVLDLPEYRGTVRIGVTDLTLPQARYTRPPEVAAVLVWVLPGGGVTLSRQPLARVTRTTVELDNGRASVAPGVALDAYPGPSWEAARAALDQGMGESLRAAADAFGFDADAVGPANVIPKVVVGGEASGASLLAVGDAIAHRGHPRLDLVVSDVALERAGLVRLWVGRDRPRGAPWVRVEQGAVVLGTPRGEGWVSERFPTGAEGMGLTELYLRLMPLAAAREGERLPTLGVEIAPEASAAEVVKVLDVVRYWWSVAPGASGEAILGAEPQAVARIPKVLAERLVWVLP
ncbi:MAG: hypothetical protein CMH57_14595 [Myxococcales bacterium]|nr:hypothetical protein [Myxococcales bacterium]